MSAGGKVQTGMPARYRAHGRSPVLGTAKLVPVLASRASGNPRRSHPDGHVVHGASSGAKDAMREPCSTTSLPMTSMVQAGLRYVHAVAQSGRDPGSGSDRDQAGRGALLGGGLRHRASPCRDLDAEALPSDAHAFCDRRDLGYAQLNVQGPRSRELLQSVTTADLSNLTFPFRAAREIDIGFACALCIRITYLGELGYELYIPTEQAVHVYDRLVASRPGDRAASCWTQRHSRQSADGEGLPRLRS